MNMNLWRGIFTVIALMAFIGLCIWVYAPKNRQRFKQDGNIPFADQENSKESQHD